MQKGSGQAPAPAMRRAEEEPLTAKVAEKVAECALARGEPVQKTLLEFLRGGAESAAVVGSGDFPELRVGGARVNKAGVAEGDVAVDLAVDEKNWDAGCGRGVLGGDLLHAKVVLPAGPEESGFDEWTKDDASYPWPRWKGCPMRS
jgi:hypothetical protein